MCCRNPSRSRAASGSGLFAPDWVSRDQQNCRPLANSNRPPLSATFSREGLRDAVSCEAVSKEEPGKDLSVPLADREDALAAAVDEGCTGVKVICDGRVYTPNEFA